jgi:arylsulfatase A-like enzyme
MLKKYHIVALVIALFSFPRAPSVAGAERPNILWITAEDMSPALGCYGDDWAITPNLDWFATESVRYTHAFATAPVCSPSRNCLITGCYPTSLGTHNMRSAFPLPESIRGFPEYLRDAGYYTTNNQKTDYNTAAADRLIRDSWNESSGSAHWRGNNDPSRPFFSVFNLMVSHQSRSMVWPTEQFVEEVQSQLKPSEIHDPAEAQLPPYYPDTPVVRREWARFYDCVTVMDSQVGKILQQLEEDGLADDTIVFFYSDHGSGMPRHKRLLLDSGMHVPLMIRFPQKYQHLAPSEPGTTCDRLVSFVDFPPTVLDLAGVEWPSYLQGLAFLGDHATGVRFQVFGHRDRIDESFDMARSVRSRRFLYIRNFMPHLGYHQPSAWPDAGEISSAINQAAASGEGSRAFRSFVSPTRPLEELYDCETDIHNVNNLALDPSHADTLQEMRLYLAAQMTNTGDRGVIPETLLFQNQQYYLLPRTGLPPGSDVAAELVAADKAASSDEDVLLTLTKHQRPGVRYWGVTGLAGVESLSSDAEAMLTQLLQDESPPVRIAAADALARHDRTQIALPILVAALQNEDLNVVLHAMRTIELIGPSASSARNDVELLSERCKSAKPGKTKATFVQTGDQDLLMFIGFSAGAFLKRLG